MHIDLRELPSASRYEDQYQQYMDIFKRIALTPFKDQEDVIVDSPPWCWVPLLEHLKCIVMTPRIVFDHCRVVKEADVIRFNRTAVEVLCGFRPECTDALWKCDVGEWPAPEGRTREYKPQQQFIVTTNGSFHRPEVLRFMEKLKHYHPTKRKVLLVPCAADKPYPSPMHKKCLALMPDDFYMMNATGVLGLVPQEMWDEMPWYDSGVPNEWRLYQTVLWYFTRFPHDKVVVYCDFYSIAIQHALQHVNQSARYVLPVKLYEDYVDLMRPDLLMKLYSALTI